MQRSLIFSQLIRVPAAVRVGQNTAPAASGVTSQPMSWSKGETSTESHADHSTCEGLHYNFLFVLLCSHNQLILRKLPKMLLCILGRTSFPSEKTLLSEPNCKIFCLTIQIIRGVLQLLFLFKEKYFSWPSNICFREFCIDCVLEQTTLIIRAYITAGVITGSV